MIRPPEPSPGLTDPWVVARDVSDQHPRPWWSIRVPLTSRSAPLEPGRQFRTEEQHSIIGSGHEDTPNDDPKVQNARKSLLRVPDGPTPPASVRECCSGPESTTTALDVGQKHPGEQPRGRGTPGEGQGCRNHPRIISRIPGSFFSRSEENLRYGAPIPES